MIFNVNGVIIIDGVPAKEIVAAAERNGWVKFPMRAIEELAPSADGEYLGIPIDRSVNDPLNNGVTGET